MTLTPFLTAAPHIQLHAIAALLALFLGPIALYRTRRDRLHKVVGYVWMLAMLTAVLSSFAISNFGVIGPVSPIHLLSVLALWSLWRGIVTIRAGQVAAHHATLRSLYWRGVIVAALFNFMPTGRVVNRMVFPDTPQLGWVVIGAGLVALVAQAWLARRRRDSQRGARAGAQAGAVAG